jgi:4-hydroxybenzoate polyprenyltransferase
MVAGLDGMAKLNLLVWEIGRLPVSLISGATVVALLAAASNLAWADITVHLLPITLVTMAGFVFNDLYDREKDRIAGAKKKPIADGRIGVTQGYLFAALLSGGALALAAAIERGHSFYVIMVALAGVTAYSFIARRVPVIKGFVTAVLCCTPLAYGSEVARVAIPGAVYAFFAAFVVGRELVLDVIHFPGDMRAGVHTLVAYFAPSISRIIGWTTMAGSVVALMLGAHGLGRAGFTATLISLAGAGWMCTRDEANGVVWTRITLLLGAMSGALSL